MRVVRASNESLNLCHKAASAIIQLHPWKQRMGKPLQGIQLLSSSHVSCQLHKRACCGRQHVTESVSCVCAQLASIYALYTSFRAAWVSNESLHLCHKAASDGIQLQPCSRELRSHCTLCSSQAAAMSGVSCTIGRNPEDDSMCQYACSLLLVCACDLTHTSELMHSLYWPMQMFQSCMGCRVASSESLNLCHEAATDNIQL